MMLGLVIVCACLGYLGWLTATTFESLDLGLIVVETTEDALVFWTLPVMFGIDLVMMVLEAQQLFNKL